MANGHGGKRPGAGRRKGAKEVAHIIREAFIEAARKSEEEGKPLADLLKAEIQARPLDAIKALSSYAPKDLNVTHEDGEWDGFTDEEIDALLVEARRLVTAGGGGGAAKGQKKPNGVH